MYVTVTVTEYPGTVDLCLLNQIYKSNEKPTYDLKKLSVGSATEIAKSFEEKPETATVAIKKGSQVSSNEVGVSPKKKSSKSGKAKFTNTFNFKRSMSLT